MSWGKPVPPPREPGYENFAVERTTLLALLGDCRAFVFVAGTCAGVAFGFVLGAGAVAWW
jgi:hypothetical protein